MCVQVCIVLLFCAGVLSKNIKHEDEGDRLILTPLIESNQIEKARSLSEVDPTLFDGVKSYSAYVTVNKTFNSNLFFWYFPAAKPSTSAEDTPWLIWLQGGPGGSSLFGLFVEIGPLTVVNNTVKKMPITWGDEYSLLFIDNPVGTGFSYTDNGGFSRNEDMVGSNLLNFLQQFLQVFPELRKAPLFISGESYAGKYIPAFGHYIHNNKNESHPINLKGLAIGDGWTDPPSLIHQSDFALQVGLLSPEQAKIVADHETKAMNYYNEGNINKYVECSVDDPQMGQMAPGCYMKHFTSYFPLLFRIVQFIETDDRRPVLCFHSLAVPSLTAAVTASEFPKEAKQADSIYDNYVPVSPYNYLKDFGPLDNINLESFLNERVIQNAIHVGKANYSLQSSDVDINLNEDIYDTVKPWLEELIEYYGVMCYSGQLDVIVAYALSVNMYQHLKWSKSNEYMKAERVPLFDNENPNKINSFIRKGGNFWDVMVRGAGHMVPADQPRAAKQIIDLFIREFK